MGATPFTTAPLKKEGLFQRLAKHAARFTRTIDFSPLAEARRGYPKTGTGIRQGARLSIQMAHGQLDFQASDMCCGRIHERARARAAA